MTGNNQSRHQLDQGRSRTTLPKQITKVEYIDNYQICESNHKDEHGLFIKSSIRNNIDFWVNVLKVYVFIEDVTRNGFIISFETEPNSIHLKNNMSA